MLALNREAGQSILIGDNILIKILASISYIHVASAVLANIKVQSNEQYHKKIYSTFCKKNHENI